MTFRIKGYGWYGWTIERPSFANGGQYVVTAPERPGERHEFNHPDQAEQFAELHPIPMENTELPDLAGCFRPKGTS